MNKCFSNAPALNIFLKWAQEKSYSCSGAPQIQQERKRKFSSIFEANKTHKKIKYVVLFLSSSQETTTDETQEGRKDFSQCFRIIIFLLVGIKQTIQ